MIKNFVLYLQAFAGSVAALLVAPPVDPWCWDAPLEEPPTADDSSREINLLRPETKEKYIGNVMVNYIWASA